MPPTAEICKLVVICLTFFNPATADGILQSSLNQVEDHLTLDSNSTHRDLRIVSTAAISIYQRLPPPSNKTIKINATDNFLNATNPTKILIHGIGESHTEEWVDRMVLNYHTKGDYNVLVLDYSDVFTVDNFYSVEAVNEVGQVVGEFIMEVTTQDVISTTDVHLIGKGLGAHVGGAAGKTVSGKGEDKVGRITGLDPDEMELLGEEDAEFVDVIHTSSVIGEQSLGTADFYVYSNDTGKPLCINGTCAEVGKAHVIYAASILDANRYKGVSCHNLTDYMERLCNEAEKAYLGENVSMNATGNYYYMETGSARATLSEKKCLLSLTLSLIIFYILNY